MINFFRLMGLQRKMYEANKALSYFVTNDWDFKNDKLFNICRYLRYEDTKDFDYRYCFKTDAILSARNCVMGFRRYLLKEKDESLPQSRKTYQRLNFIANVGRFFFYSIAFFLIFVKFDIVNVARNYWTMNFT